MDELETLLDIYWNAAYAEGKEGRTTDTPDGLAQRALTDIRAHVASLVAAERAACARFQEERSCNRHGYDKHGDGEALLTRD